MEKLLFLFRRKEGLTRQAFGEHYLSVHAPLGMRVTRAMRGYVVNLVESDDPVDAVTEIWAPSAEEFFDPARAFASPEGMAELVADHNSFLGPFDAYVVRERVVRDGALDGSLGRRTPGAKVIELHTEWREAEPPPGATRVVDNEVLRPVTPDAPALSLVRMSWWPSTPPQPVAGLLVGEYRQMEVS
jgi:hypothetical protein